MSYNVDLLTRAIQAVREGDDLPDEPVYELNEMNEYRVRSYPMPMGHRVARQVLILSGHGAQASGRRVSNLVVLRTPMVERAAELLGLESPEVVFSPDVTLADIERYRDQMADGIEPEGFDYADLALQEVEE